jgi:hypothetical protein
VIKRVFGGVLALMMIASVVANAKEPVGIEIRKRNLIGTLGVVNVQPTVKTEADGTVVVSFQAPEPGTYFVFYTTGPNKGKNATSINVTKPGPATAKIKAGSH